MSGAAIILALVGFTSLVASGLGAKRCSVPLDGLWKAISTGCEAVGMMVAFFSGNVVVWGAIVVSVRALTSYSPSFYVIADESLLVLSAFQGLVFACWLAPRADGEPFPHVPERGEHGRSG